jgi:hypothetical protein
MSDRTWIVAAVLVLAACGGPPADGQAGADDALRDAARAPLEAAEDVQQTLDARARKTAEATAVDEGGEEERP